MPLLAESGISNNRELRETAELRVMIEHLLRAAAVLGMFVLSISSTKAAEPIYTVKLFNIDDYATVYVNKRPILACTYRRVCTASIDRFLRRGSNLVIIEFGNKSSGYTWGYELSRRGKRVAGGRCGIVRKVSCGSGVPEGVYKTITREIVLR